MARIPRKHQLVDQVIYHVLNRGNGRMTIFLDETDHEYFLRLLERYRVRFRVKIYHWVLMGNHFHLVLEAVEPEDLRSFMAGLSRAYVHYHHRRYNSSGHLWQERYKSQAIQKENYLLACGRYVERNPVRARLVIRPWEYRWSSCRYYVEGQCEMNPDVDPMYEGMGRDTEERYKKYREWVITDEGDNGRYQGAKESVGDNSFLARLRSISGRILPRRRGRPTKHREELFLNPLSK